MSELVHEQAAPVPNDKPAIWDLVIADMQARDRVGRERYGTPLQAGNGRDALVDAYQEALDLVVYLRQAIEERAGHAEIERLRRGRFVDEYEPLGANRFDEVREEAMGADEHARAVRRILARRRGAHVRARVERDTLFDAASKLALAVKYQTPHVSRALAALESILDPEGSEDRPCTEPVVLAGRPGLTEEQARRGWFLAAAWARLAQARASLMQLFDEDDEKTKAAREWLESIGVDVTADPPVVIPEALRAARGETGPAAADPPQPDRPAGLTAAMHDAAQRPSEPPASAFGEWPDPEADASMEEGYQHGACVRCLTPKPSASSPDLCAGCDAECSKYEERKL